MKWSQGGSSTQSTVKLLLLHYSFLQSLLRLKQLVSDSVHRCSSGHHHLHYVNVVDFQPTLVKFLAGCFT